MITFKSLKNDDSSGMNITPLVDVVFILLIFFLLTSHIEQGIVIDLPQASSSQAFPSELLELVIDSDSHYLFNGISVKQSELNSVLDVARKRAPNVQIIVLRADGQASVESFVEAMDSIRQTGFYNLVIATSPKATTSEQ